MRRLNGLELPTNPGATTTVPQVGPGRDPTAVEMNKNPESDEAPPA